MIPIPQNVWLRITPLLPQSRHAVMRLMFGLVVAIGFLLVNLCLLLYAADKTSADITEPVSNPDKPPIKLVLDTTQNIYSSRQGLMLKMELIATERAKVCVADDVMSQLQIKVSKSGVNIPLKPLMVNDNSTIFQKENMSKWLDPGQKLTYHINLKRLKFADGSPWIPGEYSASAIYMLCPQTKDKPQNDFLPLDSKDEDTGDEIPVKNIKPVWFMIMS